MTLYNETSQCKQSKVSFNACYRPDPKPTEVNRSLSIEVNEFWIRPSDHNTAKVSFIYKVVHLPYSETTDVSTRECEPVTSEFKSILFKWVQKKVNQVPSLGKKPQLVFPTAHNLASINHKPTKIE